MGGALLTPLDLNPAGADPTALVVRLLPEVDQLRSEVSTLRRENLQWRQQAA